MPVTQPNYSSQHNRLIRFAEFPQILFNTKEGGEIQTETTQQHPGGSGPPVTVDGPTTVTPITVTKPYDPIVDKPLVILAKARSRGVKRLLTLLDDSVDAAGVLSGDKLVYMECTITSFVPPATSKGSAEAGMISITIQPRYLA